MPELGSAYYTLTTDSSEFNTGVAEAEAIAQEAASSIGESFTMVSEQMQLAGMESQAMGAEFAAAGEEAAAGVESGMAAVSAASEEAAAAGEASASTFADAWATAKSAMMGLFAGGMVIGMMDMMIGKAIDYGHTILQLSSAFNMTTEEAARLNAETNMVGMQGSSVMMTIARLTKAAGDSTNTTALAMQKWGIDISKFRTTDVQGQLQMLADAYHNAGDKSTQFLSDVLGGRGMKIAPLIDEFKQLNEATDGIHFATPTPEDLLQMEKFKVELTNITTWMQVKLVPVLITAAPLIALVGGAFIAWKVISAVTGLLTGLFNVMVSGMTKFVMFVTGTEAMDMAQATNIATSLGQAAALEAVAAGATTAEATEVGMQVATESLSAAEEANALASGQAALSMESFNASMLGGVVAAGAVGFAIGTALNHALGISDKLVNIIEGPAMTGDQVTHSVNNQVDAIVALQKQYANGSITADKFTSSVGDLNAQYGTSMDATVLLDQATRNYSEHGLKEAAKRAAEAAAKEAHLARVNKAVTAEGFKTVHMFDKWKAGIMNTMTQSMTSVGSFQKKWQFTGKSFVKTMNEMAKKDQEMVRDLVQFNKVAVPPDFKVWLESQGPDAIHGFMQSNKQGQDQVVQDWKKSQGAVKAYGDQLNPITIAGGSAFDPLASSAEGGKTAVDNLSTSIQNLHNNMDGLSGSYTITVTSGAPLGSGGSGSAGGSGGGGKGGHGGTGHRAGGGPVFGGSPYLIGERGPEIFVPNENGRVISHKDMSRVAAGAGGAGGAVVTRLRIEDWETGLATIEVMARDAARDETGQDGARSRMRRYA